MSPASIPEGSSGTEGEEGLCDKKAFYWLKEPALLSDYFLIFEFKVTLCPLQEVHDWRQCPFAHPAERDRRRCPCTARHALSKTATCPVYRKGKYCARFEACPYAHGVFETWLHPRQYRIQMCSEGDGCTRELCFFAHNKSQLRFPTSYEDIPALKARLAEASKADVQAACKRLGLSLDSRPATPELQEAGGASSLDSKIPPMRKGGLLSSATSRAQSDELTQQRSAQLSDPGSPVRQRRPSTRVLPLFRPERSFRSSGQRMQGPLVEEMHAANALHQQGSGGSSDGGGKSTRVTGFYQQSRVLSQESAFDAELLHLQQSGQMYRSCSVPDADAMPPMERLQPAARAQSDSLSMLLDSLDHLELLQSSPRRKTSDLSIFSSSQRSASSAASELLPWAQMLNLRAAGLQTVPVQMDCVRSDSSALEEMSQTRALALRTTPGYFESSTSVSTAVAERPRTRAPSLPWATGSCAPAGLRAMLDSDQSRPWSPGLSATDMAGISAGGLGMSGDDPAPDFLKCVTESQRGVQKWPLDLFVPLSQPTQLSYTAGLFSEGVSIVSPFDGHPPLLAVNPHAYIGPTLQDNPFAADVDNEQSHSAGACQAKQGYQGGQHEMCMLDRP